MDLKSEPQVFISEPNLYNIISMMNNDMDYQPMKHKQDLNPTTKTSDTEQESKQESSNDLGVSIVL